MLSIRLLRTGKKNQPFYRMVVTDKKNPPRGGRFLEIVGFFNPFTKEKQIKADRIKHWISVGAKASDTVHNILVKEKVIDGVKIAVHKKPKKKAVEAKAKASADAKALADKEASSGKKLVEQAPAEEQAPATEELKATEEIANETQVEPVGETIPLPEVSAGEAEKAE
ncbi:MAG: 30S ribosomal protein S16 [Patescibacteria group bacterium]